MKKYLKFNLFILFLIIAVNNLNAQGCPPWAPDCNPGGGPADGDGSRSTPIDDYLPVLIITAITIGGAISYRQRELFKK